MDFVEVLTKKIDDQRQLLTNALTNGAANDFASYRHLCGRLQGLADAKGLLNDLAQTLKETNED